MTKGDAKKPMKGIREVDPKVTKWKKKNGGRFFAVVIFYYATAIFAYCFDLGENETLAAFARYMESVIPSIHRDAAISPDPNYARLMLGFSWIYGIPAYIAFIWNLNIDYYEQRGVDISGFKLLGLAVIFIGGLWVVGIKPMSPIGNYRSLFLYDVAKSFALGIAAKGTVVWLAPSLFLFILTIILPLKIRRKFRKS